MTNNLVQQDMQQRERALNPRESFIIQAPAGSGKTELIIQRFLTLLNYVKKPEEILAITFTKKSAHEMRSRVIHALEQARTQPKPEKAHELRTWNLANAILKKDKELEWNLIENPNQLHIKTIDSFCSYLTSQLPLLSHFGSQPDITTHAKPLYHEAILEVLSHVEEEYDWSSAVAKLLLHSDNDLNKLSRLLIQLLQKRDQWLPYLNLDLNNNEIREILTKQIADVIHNSLDALTQLFPHQHEKDLLTVTQFAGDNLVNNNPDNKILLLRDRDSLPDSHTDNLHAWQAISSVLLTKDLSWRKQPNPAIGFPFLKDLSKEEKEAHKPFRALHKQLVTALADNDALRSALADITKMPDPYYSDEQWEILKALLEVLKIASAQLRVTFQSHGQIDFIENAQAAIQALGNESNPTDLALSLDYQIKHILVDEFQDTSFTQYRLLEMLTHGWMPDDGRSLFVVGDPMQSIYRFRLAEVGLFIRMQKYGIGQINLNPLTLSVNFRSAKNIVDWNNHHFDTIFPNYSDIGSGAVHYSQSIANANSDDKDAEIHIRGHLEADANTQANSIIWQINQTLSAHPNEKIAILVRSRTHLSAIIPALKKAKLHYNALEIDPLISRQSIQDLMSLTRALIHPADRIAWLALLRAPWCGLLLSDLLLLAGKNKHHVIWERINNAEVVNTLSSDGKQRLQKIMPTLKYAIEERERSSTRQWIESAWLSLGGPATLNNYDEMGDVKEFFDLLDEFSNSTQTLNIESLNEHMGSLYASTHHDDALIQIMTIHSAKGLEFDSVILPHLEKTNPADDKALLSWMEYPLSDDNTSLLLAPIHASGSDKELLYSYIERLQRIKSEFETDRLFYVATTRAKKRLYLFFNSNDIEKNERKGSFLGKLWPLIKNTPSLFEPLTEETKQTPADQKQTVQLSRVKSEWTNPIKLSHDKTVSSHKSQSGFQLRDDSAKIIGTTAHSILQQISESGHDWWSQLNADEKLSYAKRQLSQFGITTNLHQHASTTILKMIDTTLNDERGKWILDQHQDAQSEFALSFAGEEGPETIIIDRTFIDEHGSRWIIDYKTAESQDDDIDLFLAKQKSKYSKQMLKYKHAMSQIEPRPIKLGLYFPAMAAWCELD